MIKPFDLDELNARIRAILRRSSGRSNPKIVHGDIELDPASHTVTKAGDVIDLPPRAFAIFQTLLENADLRKACIPGKTKLKVMPWKFTYTLFGKNWEVI